MCEPRNALDGGEDGLAFYPRLIEGGEFLLRQGGYLILEVGYGQSREVTKMIEISGRFIDIRMKKDYGGVERIITARRK